MQTSIYYKVIPDEIRIKFLDEEWYNGNVINECDVVPFIVPAAPSGNKVYDSLSDFLIEEEIAERGETVNILF